jgi:large subunit ribosomal protein L2
MQLISKNINFYFLFLMRLRIFRDTIFIYRSKETHYFERIDSAKTEKRKIKMKPINRSIGRNNEGVIMCRHRGSGNKVLYRTIDFFQEKKTIIGRIRNITYDPNRNSRIAVIYYPNGKKSYIICAKGIRRGRKVVSGFRSPIKIGNSLALKNVPLGTNLYNVEFFPGFGIKMSRSAGTSVKLVYREKGFSILRLPSGESRLISEKCWATVGQVGNIGHRKKKKEKAGRIRWLGWRPTVRGRVINPVDHPHGGGEGRCSIGRDFPTTPWGKPRLCINTRKTKKYSNDLILARKN